jgi:hypothetical protein
VGATVEVVNGRQRAMFIEDWKARAESAERERDELRREIERLRAIADAAMNIGYFTGPIEHRGDSMTISKTVAHKFAYDWNDALNALLKSEQATAKEDGNG